jgi:hypothetical protein
MHATAACPVSAARAAATPLRAWRAVAAPPLRVAPRASRRALALAPRAVAAGASYYGDHGNASGAEVRPFCGHAARGRHEKRRGDRTTQRACPSLGRHAARPARRAADQPPLRRPFARWCHGGAALRPTRRRGACQPPPFGTRAPTPTHSQPHPLSFAATSRSLSLSHDALRARSQNLKRLLVIGEMQVLAKLRREHKWNDEEEVVREEIAHAASRDASAAAARDAEENAFLAMDAPNARSGR